MGRDSGTVGRVTSTHHLSSPHFRDNPVPVLLSSIWEFVAQIQLSYRDIPR